MTTTPFDQAGTLIAFQAQTLRDLLDDLKRIFRRIARPYEFGGLGA